MKVGEIKTQEQESDVLPFRQRLEIAASMLDPACIPSELPCRNEEKQYIRDFITSSLESGGSATSLYISGMPGTGKTATTLEIIHDLKKSKVYPAFKFIKVNGMSLSSPQHIYTIIWQKLINKTCRPATAALLLEELFSNKRANTKTPMTVLLLDELDALITRKQNLLYNLFNWPAYENSKLIIVAIANTMDLPEGFLSKIKSRIGEKRLVYTPYNADQIKTILESRLKNEGEVFSTSGLWMIANKVASLSGDFRRALQVCKRAVGKCRFDYDNNITNLSSRYDQMVQYEHIMKTFDEFFDSSNNVQVRYHE
jgi:origin recognition complex subunit 1